MTVSKDELKLGFCLGKRLPTDAIEINEIVVYQRNSIFREFELEKILDFEKDSPHYQGACCKFYFNTDDSSEIIFGARDRIFAMKYNDDGYEPRVITYLENPLDSQVVDSIVFNEEQTKLIMVSDIDCMYIELPIKGQKYKEIDIDDREHIKSIENILVCDGKFFIVANKWYSQLGVYLLSLDPSQPEKHCEHLIKWQNKLDIGDVDMYQMKELIT